MFASLYDVMTSVYVSETDITVLVDGRESCDTVRAGVSSERFRTVTWITSGTNWLYKHMKVTRQLTHARQTYTSTHVQGNTNTITHTRQHT